LRIQQICWITHPGSSSRHEPRGNNSRVRSAAEEMNLVAAVMVRSWSSTDQGFGYSSPSLVSALSHHLRKQAPGGTILGRLAVPLSGEVFATRSIFVSEFVGISLHPYSSMRSNDQRTLRGHEKIHANLAEHLGQPIDAWMARTPPPRPWTMDDGRSANGRSRSICSWRATAV